MKVNHLAVAFWTVLNAAAGPPPAITVRLYDYAGVPENIRQKAEFEAQRVVRAAGVEIQWTGYALRDRHIQPLCPACGAPVSPADILLRIVPRSMEPSQDLGHSLGCAARFAGEWPATRAYVLYDRVREKGRKCEGISEFRLLACVMAHEVGHLLFGDERHSRSGIMMASWQEKEMVQIERGIMAFSPDEARLLVAGAMARVEGH
jgi:hypothetical protein